MAYLTPGVSGQWLFKSKNYLGLADQLVFKPAEQIDSNSEYYVYLKDIHPLLSLTKPHDYLFLLPTSQSLAIMAENPETTSPTPESTITPTVAEPTASSPTPTSYQLQSQRSSH